MSYEIRRALRQLLEAVGAKAVEHSRKPGTGEHAIQEQTEALWALRVLTNYLSEKPKGERARP